MRIDDTYFLTVTFDDSDIKTIIIDNTDVYVSDASLETAYDDLDNICDSSADAVLTEEEISEAVDAVALAQTTCRKLFPDNDKSVLLTVYVGYGLEYAKNTREELEDSYEYEFELAPDFNYLPDDENESVFLTLSTGHYRQVIQYQIASVNEDDVCRIQELIEDEDTDSLWEEVDANEFDFIELYNLWGEDDEVLNYTIETSDGDEIESGELEVLESNVLSFDKNVSHFDVGEHILVRTDSMKRTYGSFRVPKNIDVKNIRFVSAEGAFGNTYVDDYTNNSSFIYGDTVTSLGTILYKGEEIGADDYSDAGGRGDTHFYLLKYIDDKHPHFQVVAEL